MKTASLLVDTFDFYGQELPLQVFGAPQKKSVFGAIVGFTSLLAIGAISIYFLFTLFARDTKQIIKNDNYSSIPVNNLTNVPITVTFQAPWGDFIPMNAGIWDFNVHYLIANWTDTVFYGYVSIPLEVRTCTKEDLGDFNLPADSLPYTMCIPLAKYNLTLNSKYGETINGWSSLQFNFLKCSNSTGKCMDQAAIDFVLEGGIFNVAFLTGTVNNDNNTNPNKQILKPISIVNSISLYQDMSLELTQNLYTDDFGFVFESLVVQDFFTVGKAETTYSLNHPPYFISATEALYPVCRLYFFNSPYVTTYKRTFLKAQTILANIGGVVKFIMIVAQVISQFVTRKNVYIQIGNAVFNYDQTQNSAMKKKSQKNKVNGNNIVLDIEEQLEGVVPTNTVPVNNAESQQKGGTTVSERKTYKIKTGKFRNAQNKKRVEAGHNTLKLTLSELVCMSGCVRNKNVMKQYDITQRIILERISVHSLIKDSYKLENLSRLTLDADQYRKINELTPLPAK